MKTPISSLALAGEGSNVHVGEDAPDAYEVGDLWFNTTDTELTLYVYDGSVWVPAAPPVSLDMASTAGSATSSRWSSHSSRLWANCVASRLSSKRSLKGSKRKLTPE